MRRTEINDAGQIDGRIDGQIARPTDRLIGHRIDRATTSLTPYGMSFWALILAACGGGGGGGGPATTAPAPAEKLQREGYVYDGPVKGAVVYVDANNDGQLNPGLDEYVGTTDSSGAFRGSISAQNRGKRYIVDLTKAKDLGDDEIEGTADDQNLSEFGTWLAPEGATVVSALTHLIATRFYQEQEVKSAFPGFNPLVDNPYRPGLTPEKVKAFEIVRKALPDITRLVKENRKLIEENAHRIERNSEDIGALKDDLNELKVKFGAIAKAATQQQEQEEAAPAPAAPQQEPAPVQPTQPPNIAPSLTITPPNQQTVVNETIGNSVTPRNIDTGIGVAAHDPEGNLSLEIHSQQNGQWVIDDRFEVQNGRLVVLAGKQFDYESRDNPGGTINLRITASDGTNPGVEKTTTVQLTNADDPATGKIAIATARSTPQDWPTLTASITEQNDPDGIASTAITWTRNGSVARNDQGQIITGNTIIPDEIGSWRAVLTITDDLGNELSFTSVPVNVTAPELAPNIAPSLTITPPNQQTVVNETIGNSVTPRNIDTGIGVAAHDPEGDRLLFLIESRQDEQWVTDNRFEVRDGKLIVLAGKQFDYESRDNSGGTINLRITASDGTNPGVEKTTTVQLTNDPTDDVAPQREGEPGVGTSSVAMSFKDGNNSHRMDEGEVATETSLATILFTDRDTGATLSNKVVEIFSVDGVSYSGSFQLLRLFAIKDGNELVLKKGAEIEYDRKVRESEGSYEILLRHRIDDETYEYLTFTLNVEDVSEGPAIDIGGQKLVLPTLSPTEKFPTGISLGIYDLDNFEGSRVPIKPVTIELLSNGSVDNRFELVEFMSQARISRIPFNGYKPKLHYALYLKEGVTIQSRDPITLTIKATDASNKVTEKEITFHVAKVKSNVVEDAETNFTLADFENGTKIDHIDNEITHVVISRLPLNGGLYLNGNLLTRKPDGHEIHVDQLRNLTYLPTEGGNGDFGFRLKYFNEDYETILSLEYTMRIDVAAINDVPTGSNKVKAGAVEGQDVGFTEDDFAGEDASANDVGQDITHVVITSLPTNGTLLLNNNPLTLPPGGREIPVGQLPGLTYRAAVNSQGANHGNFNFKLRDSGSDNNLSPEYTMRIDVAAAPEEPPVNPNPVVPDISNQDGTKPTGVRVEELITSLDEGTRPSPNDPLAEITIIDDGQGTVGLELLPADSLFLYVETSRRGVYRLFLKSNVKLDQSKVGPHTVSIQATGTGTGPDPAPGTFTLTVENVEHNPVLTPGGAETLSLIESTSSAAAYTGLWFTVADADGNFTGPPSVDNDRFHLKLVGEQWQLWVKENKTFTVGESITLTITATDSTGRKSEDIVLAPMVVNNVEHRPVLTKSDSFSLTIDETTNSAAADTGLRFRVTDADNNFFGDETLTNERLVDQPFSKWPVVNDNRFELRWVGYEWQLWVKSGQTFTVNESISLTINAADLRGDKSDEVVLDSITVQNVDHDPMVMLTASLTPTIIPTTSSDDADTGVRFAVTDADGNFTGPPTVDDDRFYLKRVGAEWQLWVKQGKTFTVDQVIFLTITATDDAGDEGSHIMELQVKPVSQPQIPQPDPESPPLQIPSSLTFDVTGQQKEIQETSGTEGTDESVHTGFTLTSDVAGLFAAARVDSDKAFLVYSRGSDGDFFVDDRFVVRGNGNLSVKKGQHLDFESADSPNGQIDLQIIFVHNNILMAKQDVSLQLTQLSPQNGSPVGDMQLIKIGDAESEVVEGVIKRVPVNTTLGVDLSGISDPDGDSLRYKFSWYYGSEGFVSRQATYTPKTPGRYDVAVDISDGTIPILRRIYFFVEELEQSEEQPTSGQGGGSAMTDAGSYDDFTPDAGMEDLGMVQNDFL